MDADLSLRYALLRAEIRRRLASDRKWHALPGLLDELHAVRCLHRAERGFGAPGAAGMPLCCRPDQDGETAAA